MKYRGVFLISIIFLLLLQFSLAISVTYTYTTVTDNVNVVVYDLSDNSLINTYNSGSTNKITIDYPNTNPASSFNTYHYKQGYLPYLKTYNINIAIGYPKQQSNCQTPITSMNLPSSVIQNQQFTINVNLGSINNVFVGLLIPSFIPPELTEYYKANTNVKLYIDNQLKDTKIIKISTIGNNLQFTPTISITGDHEIKIVTEVTDDECSSNILSESVDSIIVNPTVQVCPICNQPTSWSSCISNQQTRTNYKCDSTTNYQCQSYIETQSCTLPSQSCPTCSQPTSWTTCINSKQNRTNYKCDSTTNYQCQSHIEIQDCTITTDKCTDNTPVGSCSATKPKYCNNLKRLVSNSSVCGCDTGLVAYNNLCVQPVTNTVVIPTPTCTESWICGEWTVCKDEIQTRSCKDKNGCSPIKLETKYCTIISEKPAVNQDVEDFKEATNASINALLGRISDGIEEIIESSKYQIIILFLIISSIIGYIIYYLQSHKGIIKIKPKSKPEKKPVKINDLMLSVIDSLDTDERELCYTILENEGILQDELKNKTNLTKTKMEIALTRLERRQVIRKRDGLNPRIYINDWLK